MGLSVSSLRLRTGMREPSERKKKRVDKRGQQRERQSKQGEEVGSLRRIEC